MPRPALLSTADDVLLRPVFRNPVPYAPGLTVGNEFGHDERTASCHLDPIPGIHFYRDAGAHHNTHANADNALPRPMPSSAAWARDRVRMRRP